MSFISYSGCGTDVVHQSRESVCSRDESLNQVDSGDDIFHNALSNNLTVEHSEIITPPDVVDTAISSLWETGLNSQGLDSTVQNPNHREASATFKAQKNTTFPDIATIPLSGHDYVPQRDQEHPNLVDTLHSGGKIPAYHSEVYSIVDYLRRSKISDIQNDPTSNITPKSAKSTHLEGSSSYLFSGAAATDCSDSSCHRSSHFVPPAAPPPTEEPGPRRQLAKGEARSKLNELCVKQRWKDPEYKRVSIGVSHAPVYKYMVMTTFSMDGKEYEIEVEGEPTKDIKGAKDSAAMQALVWFEDYGFVCQ